MKYSLYKKGYREFNTVDGSYDASTKTVEVILPDVKETSYDNFTPDKWEAPMASCLSAAHYRKLKGYSINVRQWGDGLAAHYAVEALGKCSEDYKHITIGGYGPKARNSAILKAYELSQKEVYRIGRN